MNSKIVPRELKQGKKRYQTNRIRLNLNSSRLKVVPINHEFVTKIQKLFISYNKIKNLDGIEMFEDLEEISIMHNEIESWKEFLKIKNKNKIKTIFVDGNPLQNQPNYMSKFVKHFVNLNQLDDFKITPEMRKNSNKIQKYLETELIKWINQMKILDALLDQLNKKKSSHRNLKIQEQTFFEYLEFMRSKAEKWIKNIKSINKCTEDLLLPIRNKLIYYLVRDYNSTFQKQKHNAQQQEDFIQNEYNFFKELFVRINSVSSSLLNYLVENLTLPQEIQLELKKSNNMQTIQKYLFFQFKQLTKVENQQEQKQKQHHFQNKFPYLYFESYFVNTLFNFMEQINQTIYHKIKDYQTSKNYQSFRKIPQTVSTTMQQTTQDTTATTLLKNENKKSVLSHTERNLEIEIPEFKISNSTNILSTNNIKIKQDLVVQNNNPLQLYISSNENKNKSNIQQKQYKKLKIYCLQDLCKVIIKPIYKRIFYNLLQKTKINYFKILQENSNSNIFMKIEKIFNQSKMYFFQKLLKYYELCRSIQNYRNIILKQKVFRQIKRVKQNRVKALQILKKCLQKKERIMHMRMKISFTKWTWKNFNTLLFIDSISNKLKQKKILTREQRIQQQYNRTIQQIHFKNMDVKQTRIKKRSFHK